jgi:hypothetical protein
MDGLSKFLKQQTVHLLNFRVKSYGHFSGRCDFLVASLYLYLQRVITPSGSAFEVF